ncbi:MAG TPA: hypothetical protein VG271_03450 [Beijerinckiaceae bacterium]|nr:hypothetical protein [Beijerinckiaceae bacterium]
MNPDAAETDTTAALLVERARVNPSIVDLAYVKRVLTEIGDAGRMVRQGIERNDEPAAAFHVPSEPQP